MSTIYLTVPGRVATRPERLSSGDVVGVKFRVASTERRFDPATNRWVDAEPVYLTVTCWRQLAESILGSLRIGDPVIAHGKLVNSRFERDGRVEYRLEMRADAVGPDLRWSTSVVHRIRAAAADAPQDAGAEEGGGPRVPVPTSPPDDHPGRPIDDGQHRGVLAGEGAGRG